MTYEQIEKQFDNAFASNYLIADEKIIDHMHDRIKSFLKKSFIKYLQSQVEHVNAMVVNKPNEVALLNKELPSTLQTNYYNQAVGYVDAIEDIVTYLEAQIKELEV